MKTHNQKVISEIFVWKSALFENKGPIKDEAREEELAALKQGGGELKKMKKDFETGAVHNIENEDEDTKIARLEERQKLTEIGQEKFSKFKTKFENIDSTMEEDLEQKLKRMQKEQIGGLGKETLASAKERFEKGESDIIVEKTSVDIERSADLSKMKAAFQEVKQEEKKNCCICDKVVYPVEKVVANKNLYHIQCFKCCKCAKKLTPTNFNSHEGKLLCKVHMLEVFHPEIAKTMDPANTEEDEHAASDEEEFAVSSKPKQLQGVVKSGAGGGVHDELAQLKSLREKKGDFETSCKEIDNVEKRTKIEKEVLAAGKVKANADKFLSGAALENSDDESESADRDPNIVRGSKKAQKVELNFENVGDIKNKWKEGNVETAEAKEAAERKELEALKGVVSVKDRFKERDGNDEQVVERSWNKDELSTSAAAEARKSFMAGSAYDAANPVEKTVKDLDELKFSQLKGFKDRFEKGEEEVIQKTQVDLGEGVQLGNIKATFEKGVQDESEMSAEERAELKKREIEAEFQRYKLARKNAKVQEENEEGVAEGAKAYNPAEVEVKMAGKAFEKFRQIDASGASPVVPQQKKPVEPSKWDKKEEKPVAEVTNRRTVEEDGPEEDSDAFDVKNLMNKFKNIGENQKTTTSSEHRAELEALKTAAKDFKAKFENSGEADADAAAIEAKRQQMEEEFEALKREREEAQKRLEEERLAEAAASQGNEARDEDVAIKAEHASKMTAKWEKIQQKEAKKAEKGKMPEKKSGNGKFCLPPPDKCSLCTRNVYRAEQFQCFGLLYHVNCFRCVDCKQALRVEKAHRCQKSGDLYCRVHFKLMEENQKRKMLSTEENNNNEMEEQVSEI
uniref:LIM zinc-binding domain-containing protein n=1 Tax=Caenorhabditis tropicalis TaxID=1561998 RepID=A0A1I7UV16_9PELO